jgi:hypothetical protein
MWAKAYQCLLTVWPISGLYEDPVSAKNRPEIFQKILFRSHGYMREVVHGSYRQTLYILGGSWADLP